MARSQERNKRRAVTTLLDDPEWAAWSDNSIAKASHVDHKTVAAVRAAILGNSQDAPTTRTVIRNGTTYQQKVKKTPKAAVKPSNSGELENPVSPANGIVAAPASENQVSPANLISDDPAPASATPAPEQGAVAVARVDELLACSFQLLVVVTITRSVKGFLPEAVKMLSKSPLVTR